MKKLLLLTFVLINTLLLAQEKKQPKAKIMEVSCGQCQFGMNEKKGCDLAVRFNGKSYFVEGTKIDDHGDAHAHDGFCSAVRKAEVVGEVVNNKFVVSYLKLLPVENKK